MEDYPLKVRMTKDEWELLPEAISGAWTLEGDEYVAHPQVAARIEECERRYAEFVSVQDTEGAARQAELDGLKSTLADRKIDGALRKAFEATDAKPGLIAAAIRLFRKSHDILADGDEYVAEAADGHVDLDTAVLLFLETDDGRELLKSPPAGPRLIH